MFRKQKYYIFTTYYEHEVYVVYPDGDWRRLSTRDEWRPYSTEYQSSFTRRELQELKRSIRFDKDMDYVYPIYGFRNWFYNKTH